MDILVLLKMVPDIVEELEVGPNGKGLDTSFLRLIVGERDEHALEEALLLKERHGGSVTLLGLEAEGMDDVLFTGLAKGADRAFKVEGSWDGAATSRAAAAFAHALSQTPGLMPVDLILTGVSAIDDLDGWIAALLSHQLKLPYCGVVTEVQADPAAKEALVIKEFAGGVRGALSVSLPCVLGIQAAEKPPRYVPVAKVRAAMKAQQLQAAASLEAETPGSVEVRRLVKPEAAGRAEMIEGTTEEIAQKICDLLASRGLL
jgi:electron transfer flavoprotein beta subunit